MGYMRVVLEQISIVKAKEMFCFELSGECRSLEQREGEAKALKGDVTLSNLECQVK